MTNADPRIEAFFASGSWRQELLALRAILHTCPLDEGFKWRSPCYTFQQGNVATIWRLKDYCTLSFFKGVLLPDGAGLLSAPGENSRFMRVVKFTGLSEIEGKCGVLKDYINAAIEIEKSGQKVEPAKDDLDLPDELIDKFDETPDFRAAFDALTPGRQRGYILHFSQARQSVTRMARIEKSLPRIFEGKGLHDR